MAEYQTSSTDTYRLKKVHGCWFLENSYTRKTKSLPFLASKVNITLEDNLIFADDHVYEIQENDSGVPSITKVEDLIYTTEQKTTSVITSTQGVETQTTDGVVSSTEDDVHGESTSHTDDGFENSSDFYSSLQEVDGVMRSVRDINIRSYEYDNAEYAEISSIAGPKIQTKNRQEHHMMQPRAEVTRQVLIEDTKLSKLCGLSGMMELRINESGFSFYDTKRKSVTYIFSNLWIRRYECYKGVKVEIKVGRKCPKGEGEIRFTTDDTDNLNTSVYQVWQNQSKQ